MNGETIELLAVCALGLLALGTVVGITVMRQVRRFTDKLREEERAAEDERRAEGKSDATEKD